MRPSTRPFLLAAIAALGLLASLQAGCKAAAPKAVALAPVPVAVARAVTQNVPTRLEAIGAVQAMATVSVKSLVGGELKTVGFRQGEEVRRGQVLFSIDAQPYQASLAQAEANLARDLANDSQAQVEAKRYADLAKQGIVSVEQNEQLQAAAAADDSVVRADRAAVETAKLNLNYCTITSPIDGRTGSLLVQAGNVVQPNATVLVTINQITPIYVSFSVPEQYLLQLKGLNARHALAVRAQAQGDTQREHGELSFINNTIDNNTGTIQLMATFPNAAQRLWPGEYVNTDVTLSVQNGATVVPSTAVLTGQSDMYVYVVTSAGTVENRTVTTATTANGVTVIASGLAPGETVVTDGQLALYPGAKVQVRQEAKAAAASAGTQAQE
ncbi:MAG TPA: efflux RND transporter periplasmic adaptor subunit [Terriglobales bacterium]|nr:efflux RND transporter periplasmic adaptor subunit [Terriglobales bacterium]